MAELHNYSIRQNRFKRSFLKGFQAEGDRLVCEPETERHMFLSGAIDGTESEALWGRLNLEYELGKESVCMIYALTLDDRSYDEFLLDPEGSLTEKKNFMESMNAVKAVNQKDILLYDLKGRYLYIMLEVIGTGGGWIDHICVHSQGDIFMETFPEVYQEYGSFFHRYLSVFSTMYLNLQDKIESVDQLFDLDQTPAELLPVFGSWLGLDVSGDFLSEDRLRQLIKEAYQLSRMKGTRRALERLTEIVLGEKAIILEKNVLRDNTQADDQEIYEKLYGAGTYDVTMLIRTYVPEQQKSQIMFLINQFKPVRSRMLIRFLDERGNLDEHSYLDMNAQVSEVGSGTLDQRQTLDGAVLMEE